MRRADWFSRFATAAARWAGHPAVFLVACGAVVLWALTGPLADFSEPWQLTINTGTTIVTFLMVFIIQNTQNRDTAAMQLKLDELIRASKEAHNSLLDLEELSEQQLEKFRVRYEKLAHEARMRNGSKDGEDPAT
jgi:low affinity Fe/Cu permease